MSADELIRCTTSDGAGNFSVPIYFGTGSNSVSVAVRDFNVDDRQGLAVANDGTGVRYAWTRWSDNGAISHTVARTTNRAYTATFRMQYYLTMTHGTGGTVLPGSGWRNAGSTVSISATPTNNTQVSYHLRPGVAPA